MINMFVESGALTVGVSVILLPFFFAISHLHHTFDQKRRQDKAAEEQAKDKEDTTTLYAEYISYKQAIKVSLFKISYTQIFGIYSGLVYANTGSVWPAIVLHSHCNFFGFPSFDNLMN